MIGFCDLLLLRHRPGDQSFADVMQIRQNANRAAGLVRQLLAYSRQQTLQPRVISLSEVLAELAHLLRRLIGVNIDLKFEHGRDLYPVLADQGQLEQVVINLAVNARDAMPEGGTLTIRTANVTLAHPLTGTGEAVPAGDYVRIEVSDTGIGIPPDIIDRIFEPFFSTKPVGAGTGLGLATVYGIVKQSGGYVAIESAPGKGTTFTIYLPRHAERLVSLTRRDGEEEPRDLTGAGTILLVEDEDAVRLFSARALRNKGYKVIEARSGRAALDIMSQSVEQIDLLITDVVMPEIDGPALAREVRTWRPDLRVIFISGYAESAFRSQADGVSMNFLAKPFSLKQLAGKVKDVMQGAGEDVRATAGRESRR
jgi:two-component system, cell cycle sensor histidine kinase and response regulator CckA